METVIDELTQLIKTIHHNCFLTILAAQAFCILTDSEEIAPRSEKAESASNFKELSHWTFYIIGLLPSLINS